MKIDNEIEPLVREAFAAGVGREPDRLAAALQNMLDRSEETARWGVGLALAVDTYVLLALHAGRPDEEQVARLAASFTESESWAEIDRATVEGFLNALAEDRDPGAVVDPQESIKASFVVGAWLLSAFLSDDRPWTDYLDEALSALEAAPEPSA